MRRWMSLLPLLVLVLAAIFGHPAQARLLGDATISYSAERTVTVNGRQYTGMAFHIPGHDRHEQAIQGIAEVLILDEAARRGWLVLPGLKSYVEFAFPALLAALDAAELRRSPVGEETVNGVRTTKYRIDYKVGDGSRARGFAWVSPKGVLMRLDGTVSRPGARHATAIRMELADLTVGPQDPALFEVPPGLIKLPSAALQGLLSGKAG